MTTDRLTKITRRNVLSAAGRYAGAVTIVGLSVRGASAAPKLAQKLVSYQDSPKGNQQCDNCALFQAPDACQTIDGTIAPQGWCKIYRPKAS